MPDAPVQLKLTVRPGDKISASVTVSGRTVKLFLANHTRGTSFATQLQAERVDVSSAEWIVEAPSACGDNGGCQALPLAAFEATSFADVKATSATGHTGTISDPAWSNVAITLSPHRRGRSMRFGSDLAPVNATPVSLSPGGDAFTVTRQQAGAPAPAA